MTSASPVLVPREDPVGKIIFAVVALAFGLICFVALMTLLCAVLRGPSRSCRECLQQLPLQVLVTGVVGYGALGALAWHLLSGAFIKRLLETEIVPSWLAGGSVVVALLVLLTFIGATGTVALIGERLGQLHGGSLSGLRQTALATLMAVLAGWFPVIGWFVVTPALLLLSFGASVVAGWRTARGRRRKRAGANAEAVEDAQDPELEPIGRRAEEANRHDLVHDAIPGDPP
jgi:hypothetical protein